MTAFASIVARLALGLGPALLLIAVTAAREPPRLGQPFGPLVLPTVDGRSVIDLDNFRGRKLLLIEFASW